jgi:hypothetical protein
MNLLRKHRIYRYYYLSYEFNTLFERQLERIQHDPIRYYDGANAKVSDISIKAVRLG